MADLKPVTTEELNQGLELGHVTSADGTFTAATSQVQSATKKDTNKDETNKDNVVPPQVSFLQLYRYADSVDVVLVVIGLLGGILQGVTMPLFSLLFGDLLDSFNLEEDSFEKSVRELCLYLCLLGVGAAVFSYSFAGIFQISAVRQCARIRSSYLQSILRQDITWYDLNSTGEFSTRISTDIACIEMGMGEHVGKALQFLSMFLSGFAVGFAKNWSLTLVLLSILPLMAGFGAFFMSVVGELTSGGNDEYSKAGSVAEETFRSFRTVVSFRGEKRAIEAYETLLLEVQKKATKSAFATGSGMGAFHILIMGSYALGLWYGSRQVIEDLQNGCTGSSEEENLDDRVNNCTTGGAVITVFWSVLIGAMAVGQAAPSLTKIAEARGAARKVCVCVRAPEPGTRNPEPGTRNPEP
jgi:ATP-binding cassette subfamily B (MDR/TAP) protein 1